MSEGQHRRIASARVGGEVGEGQHRPFAGGRAGREAREGQYCRIAGRRAGEGAGLAGGKGGEACTTMGGGLGRWMVPGTRREGRTKPSDRPLMC